MALKKPRGFCKVYEERPPDCRAHECEVSLKTLGRECGRGCVDCCLGRDVVRDESSGLYVIEPGAQGPCTQLEYTSKPEWVRKAEAAREELRNESGDSSTDPLERVIRAEQMERLQGALKTVRRPDRELLSCIYGLGDAKPLGLEGACERLGIPLEEGKRRHDRMLSNLRRALD